MRVPASRAQPCNSRRWNTDRFSTYQLGTQGGSFNSGPLGSFVSFFPSLALLPPAIPSPLPPILPPTPPPPLPPSTPPPLAQVAGGADVEATNFNPSATIPYNQLCTYAVKGCTDTSANNFIATATVDDGSCAFSVPGCNVSSTLATLAAQH